MASKDSIRLCTFLLNDFLMAFDVTDIQEVIREQRLTPVPLSCGLVCGLMNLRGKVVMVMDLRKRFGFPDRDSSCPGTNVLYRKSDGVVSFLVDDVEDVLTVQADQINPPPAIMDGVSRELVRGVVQLPDRLVLVLDGAMCADTSTYAEDTFTEEPSAHI